MDTRVAESLAFVFNGSNMFSRGIINPLRDLVWDNPSRLQTGNLAGLDRWKLGGLVTQVGPKTQYRALHSPDLCFSSQCLCLTSLFTPSVHFHNKSLTGCTRLYGYTAEKCAVKCNTDGATGPGVGFLLDKKSARKSKEKEAKFKSKTQKKLLKCYKNKSAKSAPTLGHMQTVSQNFNRLFLISGHIKVEV